MINLNCQFWAHNIGIKKQSDNLQYQYWSRVSPVQMPTASADSQSCPWSWLVFHSSLALRLCLVHQLPSQALGSDSVTQMMPCVLTEAITLSFGNKDHIQSKPIQQFCFFWVSLSFYYAWLFLFILGFSFCLDFEINLSPLLFHLPLAAIETKQSYRKTEKWFYSLGGSTGKLFKIF